MHQTDKNDQGYFHMKVSLGSNAETGLVHTVERTAATLADLGVARALFHGDEDVVFADAGYQDVAKQPQNRRNKIDWQVATRSMPGKRRALNDSEVDKLRDPVEWLKSPVRAKGARHPCGDAASPSRRCATAGCQKIRRRCEPCSRLRICRGRDARG